MIVDGIELLRMVKEGKFEEGDEIIADVTYMTKLAYSSYLSNFRSVKTGVALSVQEYLFWSFDIPEENKEIDIQEIDIQAIEEIGMYCTIIVNTLNEKVLFNMIQNNANKIDEIINAVKKLDKKIK